MQHRQLLVAVLFGSAALAATACGGGGSVPVSSFTPAPSQTYVRQQQPITAAGGGTVSASFSSGGAISVKIAPNTLTADTTVTIYGYSTPPQTGSGTSARATGRKAAALPNNGVFLGGFSIDTGTAKLLAPVTVTEAMQAQVPAGDVVRVARFGKNGYTDVDTATVVSANVSNDVNAKYVSVSNGGTDAPYVFYAVAPGAAATPAPITIGSSSAGALVIGSSAVFSASGADANGNPLPFRPAFKIDSAVLATLSSAGDPMSATLTAGVQGGVLHLTATDARTGISGSTAVTIETQRPSNAGDTYTFTGTLTQSDSYAYPTPNPLPSDSKTAKVTQTVTVSATSNPYGASPGSVSDFNVQEQDVYPYQTLSSTTDSYFAETAPDSGGVAQFVLLGSKSVDDQGNTSSVKYANPSIVDELPEHQGQTWTNSPALTRNETFTDLETVDSTVNADGSYKTSENLYSAPVPSPSPGDSNEEYPNINTVITAYADGHGQFSLLMPAPAKYTSYYYYPPNTITEIDLAFTAPAANGAIDFMSDGLWAPSQTSQHPAFNMLQTLPMWYPPLNGSLYSETDADLGSAAIPGACNVPSTVGTDATKIEQQTNTIDPTMGSIETVQTDEYVVTGLGPVCVSVLDTNKQYYNYQADQYYGGEFSRYPVLSSTPLTVTTVSEMLALQSSSVAAQSRTRAALGVRPAIPPAAVSLARLNVQRVMRHALARRHVTADQRLWLIQSKGALRK